MLDHALHGPFGEQNFTPRLHLSFVNVHRHVLESLNTPNALLGWLLQGYQKTGDAKFLRRWSEYADDWAMNAQRENCNSGGTCAGASR